MYFVCLSLSFGACLERNRGHFEKPRGWRRKNGAFLPFRNEQGGPSLAGGATGTPKARPKIRPSFFVSRPTLLESDEGAECSGVNFETS